MKSLKLGLCAASVMLLGFASGAEAMPMAPGSHAGATPLPVEQVQYYYGGPRCFYPDGWHGPGYYRCGFRWRRGLGFFGGGFGGWHGGHGWHGGGFHGGGFHGGFHGGGHGGGFHGGGHGGGGHGGGGHGGGHH